MPVLIPLGSSEKKGSSNAEIFLNAPPVGRQDGEYSLAPDV